ncbi:MAG TPA: NADH-ubiquinone oxidoreductase-F iron-sulfur binding region domain-containing protein, partial [Thermodesulfovibrionales bacterium]|nr:NADH-ubiquinone oxidoreductase-F iron-sulfur binding region domain-containing protein [Thermodesulfovibrionales bacterium]
MKKSRASIMLCAGTGCIATGTLKVRDALQEEITKRGLDEEIKIVMTGCNGYCAEGPVTAVYPDEIFYQNITTEDVPMLVEEHFLKGRPYQKLMYKAPEKKETIPLMKDIPFFKQQVLRVLRNKGLIDPESIEDYIARDGYQGAVKALTQMTPEEVVKVVSDSGLRGRGGAGFPTGKKWELGLKIKSDVKFVVCNGDEGDPGAFMDRSVMESDPHAVIEGMLICGVATQSHKGYIYVRAEYPLAVKRLQIAINQCNEDGLLGKNILNTGFDFDLEIYQGAGAFVCGEATALMRSIEGKRGMPRPKLWRSAVKGLWDKPTVLNNVETFANIPQIILRGAEWYRSVGTEKSTGTKVFALTGAIQNVGLVEVPMDTSLRTIIYDIGGGIKKKGREFKAVQLGGPSGGCIPAQFLDIPVTYEDIKKSGAIVGSGGMVVMDNSNCMVSTSKFFLEFTAEESCGKCVPCRVGTKVMLDLLSDICAGRGKEGDIETLQDLSEDIIEASLCGLGQSAPNPVLSTIRYFRNEYEEHINQKWCRTGVCRDLCTFSIDESACKGCGACLRACPSKAIVGEKKNPHKIVQDLCVHCRS